AHPALVIGGLLVTMSATVYLYVVIPKGFFPQQDTGFITGISEAAQDISFAAMVDRQQQLAEILSKDPDIASFTSAVGATGGSQTTKTGRLFINLKPPRERQATPAPTLNPLRAQTPPIPRGAHV